MDHPLCGLDFSNGWEPLRVVAKRIGANSRALATPVKMLLENRAIERKPKGPGKSAYVYRRAQKPLRFSARDLLGDDLTKAVKAGAWSIAAVKRGVPIQSAEVAKVWPSYVGQSKACIEAAWGFIGAALLRNATDEPHLSMGDDLFAPMSYVDHLNSLADEGGLGVDLSGMSRDEIRDCLFGASTDRDKSR